MVEQDEEVEEQESLGYWWGDGPDSDDDALFLEAVLEMERVRMSAEDKLPLCNEQFHINNHFDSQIIQRVAHHSDESRHNMSAHIQ